MSLRAVLLWDRGRWKCYFSMMSTIKYSRLCSCSCIATANSRDVTVAKQMHRLHECGYYHCIVSHSDSISVVIILLTSYGPIQDFPDLTGFCLLHILICVALLSSCSLRIISM